MHLTLAAHHTLHVSSSISAVASVEHKFRSRVYRAAMAPSMAKLALFLDSLLHAVSAFVRSTRDILPRTLYIVHCMPYARSSLLVPR